MNPDYAEIKAELDWLRESHQNLLYAAKLSVEDHQCAQKCDGPHDDCPCWYCRTCCCIKAASDKDRK